VSSSSAEIPEKSSQYASTAATVIDTRIHFFFMESSIAAAKMFVNPAGERWYRFFIMEEAVVFK